MTIVRQEVAARFGEAQSFLTTIKKREKRPTVQSQETNTQKGLFLVLLYSATEYALTRSVVEFAETIKASNVSYSHIHTSLYALSLDPLLTSCATVGREMRWQRRMEVFEKQKSPEPVKLSDSAFLDQLENVWAKTIRKTFGVLGLSENALYSPRVSQYIDEVVDKRNSVAHGRESAAVVGQSYTTGRLQTLHDELSMQVQYMMVRFEQHLNDKLFIKDEFKAAY